MKRINEIHVNEININEINENWKVAEKPCQSSFHYEKKSNKI